MTTHTPGPWRAHDDDGTGTLPCVLSDQVNAGGNFYVAQCNVYADASLIAAAPEMVALLRDLYDAAQAVPILKEPGWNVGDVADALPMMDALTKLRALLAKIDPR